jgi:hypothetical protein
VARVEELVQETDVKAFRDYKIYIKFERGYGPVSREHSAIWNQFSDLTKQMHDKRELLFEKMRSTELENLEKKKRNNKPN